LEFNWGRFPPMTDIVPEGYSIRWHGWLVGPEQGTTRFTLSGQGGSSCVFLSGEELLPWGDLSNRRTTDYVGIAEGDIVPIEVYFKQAGESGVVFNFRWESISGDTVEIPKGSLLYPSNESEMIIGYSGPFRAMVEAVDWVALHSEPVGADGFLDDVPPELNLSDLRTWYNTTDTMIRFSCSDRGSALGLGSGMDPESIRYRMKESWMKDYGPWTEEDIWSITENGPNLDVLIRTDLAGDFRGFIQFKAQDLVGNQVESGPQSIGVDMIGPRFTVVEPSLIVQHVGTTVTFYVRVTDTGGSGVDGSTVMIRTRTNDTEWSDWSDVGTGTNGEEVASEFQKELVQGWNRVQFSAIDLVGNPGYSEEYTLLIKAKAVDLPPEPLISSPENGTTFTEGTPVLMDGSASKDDGNGRFDTLRHTWSSNKSGYLGSGKSIKSNRLSLGWHRITLYVDDGTPGHNVSASVEIMIKKVIEPVDGNDTSDGGRKDPFLLYLAIIAVIIIALVVFVVFFTRKRSETQDEEMKIEYRVSSTSDLEYDERSTAEEKVIGLDIGPSHPPDPDEERRRLYGEQ
jgi:hypothetical protein